MSRQGTVALLAGWLLVSAAETRGQEPPAERPTLEELQKRIEQMEQRHEEEIEDLQDQLDALEMESRAAASRNSFTERLNAFNPRITVFGNFLGRIDDQRAFNDEGESVDDRFNLREVEVDLRASIDPWADGVMILTTESEKTGDFTTGIEEGYVVLKRIPGLDVAPWGLRIQAGRFRPEFGRLNRIHLHDLPQITRPRSQQTFLGEEGFIQDGIRSEVIVPTPGEQNTLRASAAVVNGGDIAFGEDNDGEDPALLGRLGWFVELASDHEFEIGTSAYRGKRDEDGSLDAFLYAIDCNYLWRPSQWRSFLVGGEIYYAELDRAGMNDSTPFGGHVWSQLQISRNLYVSGRFDYTEELDAERIQTRTPGVFATYYTTEFLRFRIGYERVISDDETLDNLDTFFFELNFVFGSHPVEPYWVNR